MKKAEAINTFTAGLVMDINPLVAPNDGLCNALNATLVTMNGNENVLQNDMGNGRVETAYLPEGYVPLGTTELGGIIYIVSYNPLSKKCQIGSFPSPERNISSDEITDLKQTLTNQDFKYQDDTGALVYYLKKELNSELTFNPGDKFIVYGDTIQDNFDNLYNEQSYTSAKFDIAKKYTLKLDIGTITDTGKLVKFENLKEYNISNRGKYHIFQYTGESAQKPDLDEYRSLVSQPYNIFSSKISGTLVLIAELVQFNDFEISLHHKFDNSGDHKKYVPSVTFNFTGEYPFIPAGVQCKISLTKGDTMVTSNTFDYIISDNDVLSQIDQNNKSYQFNLDSILKDTVKTQIDSIAGSGYFDTGSRNDNYIIRYEFIPCMNWGPVSYLAVSGQIDLDRLGTGYIDISQWRYYNEDTKCNLTWGLEIYEEEDHFVDKVEMEFIRFINPTTTESTTYSINKKASYFGVFYDVLPLNEDYYRLEKQLKPNNLYLVKIKVTYASGNNSKESSEIREFYRWLYTNKVFNQYYTNWEDFKSLPLNFLPNFKVDYSTKSTENTIKTYGIINPTTNSLTDKQKSEALKSETSLSAIQTKRDFTIAGQLKVGLEQDYNSFYLEATKDSFSIIPNNDSFDCTSSATIKYTDREDQSQDELLASSGKMVSKEELEQYNIPTTSGVDNSTEILKIPTNVVEKGTFNIQSFSDNVYNFTVNYSALQMVKAFCTKINSTLTYKGKFIPLAYNRDTFSNYNLEWNSTYNKWLPNIIGLFGFTEQGGKDGHLWIGSWTEQSENNIEAKKQNNLDINWTRDTEILSAEQQFGWSNTAMFTIHKWAKDGGDLLRYYNGGDEYSTPTEKRINANNRSELFLKSNLGNGFFYPIDFSAAGYGDSDVSKMRVKAPFINIYNDFAQFLNNVYRYDSEETTQECIIPQYIYWMDNCMYSLVTSLDMKSTDNLNNCDIYIMLEDGKVSLKSMINTLIQLKILEQKDYPTLTSNISYTIQPINGTFKFNITNSDNKSGIEMRNKMLDSMNTTLGSALMDYNGTSIIDNVSISSDIKTLYCRDNSGGIVRATEFVPKNISYQKVSTENDYEIIPTIRTTTLDNVTFKQNLNRWFTLNEDGLLVLNNPKNSDFSFKRDYEGKAGDAGDANGYIKVRILSKYSYYYNR